MKRFSTLALLYSASHFLSPHAVADNINAPMIIDPLSIQSVRVLLAPAGFFTRYAWREEDLERFVCARQTSNRAAISSFAKVLANFPLLHLACRFQPCAAPSILPWLALARSSASVWLSGYRILVGNGARISNPD
ncbi:MAG: hypothetical protein ABW202_19020 [Duganella sp.]